MYLIGNVLCILANKSSRLSTYFTVANTKDLDPFHRGKVLEEPRAGTLKILLRRLQRKIKAATATSGGKKTAPSGVFCMSGPVAHVDEEDEEHEFLVIIPDAVSGSNRAEGCFVGEKALSNGDIYVGSWHGNLPEGMGKYLWADGCMYEGQWRRGKKTGKGKISWPSGATYEGDFMCGHMHGFGTYTGVDGATYKGQWLLNDKHGYGQKCYKIGDFYEGFWKHGVQDGRGRYVWRNGNEYVGEWRGGLMCGRGILSWSSGDKYDGQWLDGFEHGNGVYKWADGSYYVGTWSRGLKDGKGTFYPPCNHYPKVNSLHESSSSSWDLQDDYADDGGASWNARGSSLSDFDICWNPPYILGSETSSKNNGPRLRRNLSFDAEKGSSAKMCSDSICVPESNYNDEGPPCDAADNLVQSIVEREYVQGVLINEYVKENNPSKPSKRRQRRHSKEGKRPGEIIFKGHRNYDLMLNLQLGIRFISLLVPLLYWCPRLTNKIFH